MIAETKVPIPASSGEVAKHDYEYRRCGMCNIFLASEPLAGKRIVKITERKTKADWAWFIEEIAGQYESAEKITLVMDNLNTHNLDLFMKYFLRIRQKRYGTGLSLCIPRSMEAG